MGPFAVAYTGAFAHPTVASVTVETGCENSSWCRFRDALVLVRWNPSARSQSLSRDILALPVRRGDDFCEVGYRIFHAETACATGIFLAD